VQAFNDHGPGPFSLLLSIVIPGKPILFINYTSNRVNKISGLDPCGNHVCDTLLNEDCASCYMDCGICNVSAPSFQSLHAFPNSSRVVVPYWNSFPNNTRGNYVFVLQMIDAKTKNFSTMYPLFTFHLSIMYNFETMKDILAMPRYSL
jgi:hypothetical protein